MREEVRAARRADVRPLDRLDACVTQDALGDRPEVEVAPLYRGRAEPCAIRVGDVVADLVTARADTRPDRSGKVLATERRNSRLEDPLQQPEPAGMQQRERGAAVAPRQGDRETVRRELQHRYARLVRPEAVSLAAALTRDGAVDGRCVHLPVHRELLRVRADRLPETAAVFPGVLGR